MRIFLTFLVAYVLSQFYRSFLAVIAPELAVELSLSPQALGNLHALWILGFVATQFPVGWALDTAGPRRTVSLQMLLAVAGALLFAAAGSAAVLNIAMLLIGAGCGSIYMGAIYLFGRTAAPQRFALLCSWLLGLGTAGNLLAASPLASLNELFAAMRSMYTGLRPTPYIGHSLQPRPGQLLQQIRLPLPSFAFVGGTACMRALQVAGIPIVIGLILMPSRSVSRMTRSS